MMKNKQKSILEELEQAMDIVQGMSQEEIKELLLNNPLYKYIVEMDRGKEKNNGISEKSD